MNFGAMHAYDSTIRKSMHIAMPSAVHQQLKALTAAKGLSMQELLEELATRAAEEEAYMIKLIEEMSNAKRTGRKLKRLVLSERENIYDILEAHDPIT